MRQVPLEFPHDEKAGHKSKGSILEPQFISEGVAREYFGRETLNSTSAIGEADLFFDRSWLNT